MSELYENSVLIGFGFDQDFLTIDRAGGLHSTKMLHLGDGPEVRVEDAREAATRQSRGGHDKRVCQTKWLQACIQLIPSMAYWWPRRDWAEASVLSTAARDCSNSWIMRLARRALAYIKCCHLFSFYSATYVFGDSGASPSFPHLVAHNCPAALRSAANETSNITSVKGLALKGTAP